MSADARSLGRSGHIFKNWASTYSCQPELYFEPETTEEIQKILILAQEKGKKVRVVGNGHSLSDLACTPNYMISLRRYNRVLKVDKEKLQVTVQGGCTIQELNENVLLTNGMALSIQGTASDLTVAGVISTGTHGTGANYGIISSYVVELDLMKASGEIIHISKTENPDLFPAVVLGLGALGIIVSVTLQCERTFNLHQKQYPAALKDVLENLDVYVTASDHFDFFWFPYTENVICYHSNRTSEEANVKVSWFWDSLVGFHLLQLLYWISTFVPAFVKYINILYYRLVYAQFAEKIDRSDHVFNFNCLFHQYVMEWAIPRDKLGVVLMELKSWITMNQFPAHFPVEIRFVKGDDIYLSPAFGQDSCYVNIIMYRPYDKHVDKDKYWDAVERIVSAVGGRPHWGKDHKYGGEQFCKLYPKWATFCHLREQLDPNGMFLNEHLERVFCKSNRRAVAFSPQAQSQ